MFITEVENPVKNGQGWMLDLLMSRSSFRRDGRESTMTSEKAKRKGHSSGSMLGLQRRTTVEESVLDHGTTSVVTLQRHTKDGSVLEALVLKKYLPRNRADREDVLLQLKREYAILSTVDSQTRTHIVKVLGIDLARRTIKLEYLPFNLRRVLAGLNLTPTVEERRCYFKQICAGVQFLHSRGIAHRDLKLENLMLRGDACYVKIVDFGAAIKLDSGQTECLGIHGSLELTAPEIFSQLSYDPMPVDCWSLGILLFQIFNLIPGKWRPRFPWKQARKVDPDYQNYLKDPESALRESVPNESDYRELLYGLLAVDPKQRLTTISCTEHEFLKRTDKEAHNHDRTLRMCNRLFL